MHRHESPVLAGWSVALLIAAWAIWGLGLFASPMDPAVRAGSDVSSRIDVTVGVVFPYYLGCVAGVLVAPVAALRLWPMWCTALSAAALFLYLSSIWWMGNHAFRLYPQLDDRLEFALYASGAAVVTALAGTVLADVRPRSGIPDHRWSLDDHARVPSVRMNETTITLTTDDGLELQVYRWAPEGEPKAVVQVHHGLAEHSGRYRGLAEALTAKGYLVYAPDQRASGRSAAGDYGNWGPDGWAGWVNDYTVLNQHIRKDHPELKVALFGHSLGSFGAQHYLVDHSNDVDAVVLSGTGDVVALAPAFAGSEPTDLTAFNAAFEHRTGFEWLSRDEAAVDEYVADPACGWVAPPPAGMGALGEAGADENVAKIRKDLPMLLVAGDNDPVGGEAGDGVTTTAERYQAAGIAPVTVKLYPGARHEILHETNRDEAMNDIVAFLDNAL